MDIRGLGLALLRHGMQRSRMLCTGLLGLKLILKESLESLLKGFLPVWLVGDGLLVLWSVGLNSYEACQLIHNTICRRSLRQK